MIEFKKGLYNLSQNQDFTFFNLFLPQPAVPLSLASLSRSLSLYQNILAKLSASFLTAATNHNYPNFDSIDIKCLFLYKYLARSVSLWLRECDLPAQHF